MRIQLANSQTNWFWLCFYRKENISIVYGNFWKFHLPNQREITQPKFDAVTSCAELTRLKHVGPKGEGKRLSGNKLGVPERSKLTDFTIRCYINGLNSQLQKRESTEASFLYWLNWKSKHFNSNATEWKATQPSLRVFSGKLFKWEPRKSCKIPYKPLQFCGLSTQSTQTLYFRSYLKSYHFAIFHGDLKILLFLVKTFNFTCSWSFICIY